MRHDVPVGDRDIEMRVVVVVEERDAEADVRTRGGPDAAAHGGIREHFAIDVEKQAVHLGFVIGHDQTETPGAGEVAESRPHAGLGFSIGGDRHAGGATDVGERAVPVVAEEEIGHRVVGHEHVRPAVVVDVRQPRRQDRCRGAPPTPLDVLMSSNDSSRRYLRYSTLRSG